MIPFRRVRGRGWRGGNRPFTQGSSDHWPPDTKARRVPRAPAARSQERCRERLGGGQRGGVRGGSPVALLLPGAHAARRRPRPRQRSAESAPDGFVLQRAPPRAAARSSSRPRDDAAVRAKIPAAATAPALIEFKRGAGGTSARGPSPRRRGEGEGRALGHYSRSEALSESVSAPGQRVGDHAEERAQRTTSNPSNARIPSSARATAPP